MHSGSTASATGRRSAGRRRISPDDGAAGRLACGHSSDLDIPGAEHGEVGGLRDRPHHRRVAGVAGLTWALRYAWRCRRMHLKIRGGLPVLIKFPAYFMICFRPHIFSLDSPW
jgi:hypothetical protein